MDSSLTNGASLRILGLSEHFAPRVGGTARYVEQTCAALAANGIHLTLLVPGPRPSSLDEAVYPYKVVWIDAGYPENGNPTRASRYNFSKKAARYAEESAERGEIDVVHVMFGLFLMEELNTRRLLRSGVPSLATVHNIPPMECRTSFEGEPLQLRFMDAVRLKAVAMKNNARLCRYDYTAYVAPSNQVRDALKRIRPKAQIHVIGHGTTTELVAAMNPPLCRRPAPGATLNLLTVGGWVPHKRQHLVPEIIGRLQNAGIDARWTLVGPSGRLPRYKASVESEIEALGVGGIVSAYDAVPFERLSELYDSANIYVQPSTEEGFCITALDAAAGGLPVIASPAGALAEIVSASRGRLVASDARAIASAIMNYYTSNAWTENAIGQMQEVKANFSWVKAAEAVASCYEKMLSIRGISQTRLNNSCAASVEIRRPESY